MRALVLFFCKNSSIITNDEITVDIITHIKPAVFCFALSSFSLTAPLTIALGWVDRAVFEFGGRRVNVLSRQRTKGCWRSTSRLILSHLGSKYDRICNCSKSIALLTIVQVSSPSQKDACVCRCLFKVTFVFLHEVTRKRKRWYHGWHDCVSVNSNSAICAFFVFFNGAVNDSAWPRTVLEFCRRQAKEVSRRKPKPEFSLSSYRLHKAAA